MASSAISCAVAVTGLGKAVQAVVSGVTSFASSISNGEKIGESFLAAGLNAAIALTGPGAAYGAKLGRLKIKRKLNKLNYAGSLLKKKNLEDIKIFAKEVAKEHVAGTISYYAGEGINYHVYRRIIGWGFYSDGKTGESYTYPIYSS